MSVLDRMCVVNASSSRRDEQYGAQISVFIECDLDMLASQVICASLYEQVVCSRQVCIVLNNADCIGLLAFAPHVFSSLIEYDPYECT